MTTARGHASVRRAFIGVQVAASTVLLVGMGLTARGFARLERVGPGFTPDPTLSVQLSLPPRVYANRDGLGVSGAYVAAPLLFGLPFETDPRDTMIYVAVAAGLLVLSVAASYAPVRRASTANPAAALQAS